MALASAFEARTESVGHYELRQCLCECGFGRVYEAWDKTLCRSVAVKCLAAGPSLAQGAALIGEARRAASLRHPAFVKIFGFEEHGTAQYIIMELVPGTTLRNHAAGRALEAAEAFDIVDQVAAAMTQAHKAGLIHCDLKPGNLMLEASGQVRILDFGLSRQVDRLATQTAAAEDPQGTITYMAPERLMGNPVTEGSDIYALGVVLYELLAGALPFPDLHGIALAAAQVQTDSLR
jgi:serine/threonine protein kinase